MNSKFKVNTFATKTAGYITQAIREAGLTSLDL